MKKTIVAVFSRPNYVDKVIDQLKNELVSPNQIHLLNNNIPDRSIVDPFREMTQLFKQYRIPDHKNEYYNIMLKNGHYVIAVTCEDENSPRVQTALQQAGCESIESYLALPQGYESSTSSILM